MINYNCPNAVECLQTKNARGPTNTLDFLASLDLNAPIGRRALTKIACCVGPNSSTPELIEQLLSEGITTLVISTSQTDEQELQTFIRNVRKTILTFSSYCGRVYPVGIIVQLGATHLKTGFLKNNEKDEVLLNENEHICLTANEDYKCDCTKKIIYINFKDIMAVLKSDDMVYIDFGKIILQVIHLNLKYKTIKCKIVVGGMLRNEAWVYIKSIPLEYEETDTKMIEFSLKNEVDGIIVPRVQSAQDVIKIRDLIVQKDPSVMLFANIETVTGVQNIDEILEVCEGVIMSRHILNMMYPTEKMNIVQKVIIAKCNRAGKPIFVRISQFSCNTNLFVLKFEESIDMSNLILDGVDGFVLQQQVANSENLETSLKLLQRLSLESEAVIFQKQVLSNFISHVTNYKFNGDCIPIIFSHRPKLNKGELFSNCIYDRWEKVVWRFSAVPNLIELFIIFIVDNSYSCTTI